MNRGLILNLPSFLLTLGLFACTDVVSTSGTQITDPFNTPFETTTPFHNTEPTITPEVGVTSAVAGETHCIENVTTETPLESLGTGTIVDWDHQPYALIDLRTGGKFILPFEKNDPIIWDAEESPDKTRFAYLERVEGENQDEMVLWIVNPRADLLAKYHIPRSDLTHMRWAGDEQIIFDTGNTRQDGTVLVVKPFAGEMQYLANDMPDLYTVDADLGGVIVNPWIVEYSPDLHWGVYLTEVSGEAGLNFRTTAYDFEARSLIWRSSTSIVTPPAWSPDGSVVAIKDGNTLNFIDRDSIVYSISGDRLFAPVDYTWSPNGQYVVFWSYTNLYLLDYQERQIIDLCYKNQFETTSAFLWSPDSRFIVFDVYHGMGANMIDLSNFRSYQLKRIPDSQYPAIWLESYSTQ